MFDEKLSIYWMHWMEYKMKRTHIAITGIRWTFHKWQVLNDMSDTIDAQRKFMYGTNEVSKKAFVRLCFFQIDECAYKIWNHRLKRKNCLSLNITKKLRSEKYPPGVLWSSINAIKKSYISSKKRYTDYIVVLTLITGCHQKKSNFGPKCQIRCFVSDLPFFRQTSMP